MKELKDIHAMLVRMSNNLQQSQVQRKAREEELKGQGKISDLEKLSLLKQQLYRDARDGKNTTEIRKAIKVIRSEYETNRPRNIDKYNSIVINLATISILILISPIFDNAYRNCYRTQSTFCNQIQQFNSTIDRYFYGDRTK